MIRIKELRKEQELTIRQLADILGYARGTIEQWENGKREPSNEVLKRLADLFEVSLDYLLGREERKVNNTEPTPTTDLSNDEQKFVYALYGEAKELTDIQKKQLLDMAKFLKSQNEK